MTLVTCDLPPGWVTLREGDRGALSLLTWPMIGREGIGKSD
jgi:hypothetical protein